MRRIPVDSNYNLRLALNIHVYEIKNTLAKLMDEFTDE
jgi:hypothetical protein